MLEVPWVNMRSVAYIEFVNENTCGTYITRIVYGFISVTGSLEQFKVEWNFNPFKCKTFQENFWVTLNRIGESRSKNVHVCFATMHRYDPSATLHYLKFSASLR